MNGPYITSALFCEKVLNESDGVTSAIRLVDKIIVDPEQPIPTLKENVIGIIPLLSILISLKAGDAKGKGTLSLKMHTPNGKEISNLKVEIEVDMKEGGNQGANIVVPGIPLQLLAEEGVCWIDVLYNGTILTRMPLEVSVKKSEPTTPVQ